MKIVYLDQPTYLPDEWRSRFGRLARAAGPGAADPAGDFTVYEDRPDPKTALRRLCAADLAIVEWTPLPGALLRRVRRLRHLTLATSAFDFVDVAAAAEAGITVAHCPDHSRRAVAEHVFALLLAVTRHLPAAHSAVRAGTGHLYGPFLSRELRGRTLGLLGTGRTAAAVAELAAGFGMRVVAAHRDGQPVVGFEVVPLEELLGTSDALSLHIPLNASTRGLLDASRLSRLRPGAVLINTCRGELIDQVALARLLASGRLGGAGLDDLAGPGAEALRSSGNVVLTPGTAWYTESARTANLQEIFSNLESYLSGRPRNVLRAF